MRVAVCSCFAMFSTLVAASAMAQAPAAQRPPGAAPAPGAAPPPGAAPAPGAAPPGYGPPPPGYGPPPPGYGPPPPGYYYGPPPASQERTAFNNIFVEGLGPGLWYSFNYERIISDIGIRAGIGYLAVSSGVSSTGQSASAYFVTVPVDVNYIGIGSKKHIFEIGGGFTFLAVGAGGSGFGQDSTGSSATAVVGHLNLGYRMQPPSGGFLLRTGISPIFGRGVFLPWPYIALGAAF